MRATLLFALISLCLSPLSLAAAEPSKGTVIMVSSIGGWVLFSSGSVLLKEQKRAREKAAQEAAKQNKSANT